MSSFLSSVKGNFTSIAIQGAFGMRNAVNSAKGTVDAVKSNINNAASFIEQKKASTKEIIEEKVQNVVTKAMDKVAEAKEAVAEVKNNYNGQKAFQVERRASMIAPTAITKEFLEKKDILGADEYLKTVCMKDENFVTAAKMLVKAAYERPLSFEERDQFFNGSIEEATIANDNSDSDALKSEAIRKSLERFCQAFHAIIAPLNGNGLLKGTSAEHLMLAEKAVCVGELFEELFVQYREQQKTVYNVVWFDHYLKNQIKTLIKNDGKTPLKADFADRFFALKMQTTKDQFFQRVFPQTASK